MNSIKLWFIKRAFLRNRVAYYEALESGLTHVGTRRQELEATTFKRWADRDISRHKLVGYAHRAIQRRLEGGKTLSESLAPFIPVEEMLTIQAGEKGVVTDGIKPKIVLAIESARRQKESSDEMRTAINGAMLEPITQLIIFTLTSILFGAYVWPEMLSSFPIQYWPEWTLPIIKVQMWTANNGLFLTLLIVAIFAYYYSLPNWTGRVRQILEKIPPYSIYRDRMASALLGVIGGLLHGGLTLEESLRRVEARSTPYLKWHVRKMIKASAASGKDPMKALHTGLFSQDVLDRLEDAASSRDFDETLAHIGREALGSIIKVVKRAVTYSSITILALIAGLFLYQTAVQVFGVQDAADNYMAATTAIYSK